MPPCTPPLLINARIGRRGSSKDRVHVYIRPTFRECGPFPVAHRGNRRYRDLMVCPSTVRSLNAGKNEGGGGGCSIIWGEGKIGCGDRSWTEELHNGCVCNWNLLKKKKKKRKTGFSFLKTCGANWQILAFRLKWLLITFENIILFSIRVERVPFSSPFEEKSIMYRRDGK